MKKIFTLLMVATLSLVAVAQTATVNKAQAMKSLLAKERLSNSIKELQQPARHEAKLLFGNQPTQFPVQVPYAMAKAPAALDTMELHFSSFSDDPVYYPLDTIVSHNGETVITGGDWLFALENERYQFTFDVYNYNPESLAGTYTVENLDVPFSWCVIPVAPNKMSYYKVCNLTIQEEKVGDFYVKYILDAEIITTLGVGGEENGAFILHAEHQVMKPQSKMDVAILNCVVEPEEDRFRIYGKNDTMDVDLTFFTDLGVEGYYTHKLLDTENYKLVHRGTSYEIAQLEGMIITMDMTTGGVAYMFMFEALTTDAHFFNVAMEAPIVPTDTIEFTCNNLIINDAFGMSYATIEIYASNSRYQVVAGYNANSITTPAVYSGETAMAYLDDLTTPNLGEGSMDYEISSIQCTIKVNGNKKDGYQVDIEMLGNDHKYYIMHLVYGVEVAKEVTLDFTNPSKSMFYIDEFGSKEVQLANYNGEYSVSFDFFPIDEVLLREEFERADLVMEQTFIIHHVEEAGKPFDAKVEIAEVSGTIKQKNDTTYLTAEVLGFDSVLYHISMYYAVPTPSKTVTYTFDGLGNDLVDFTNALSQGIYIIDALSEDENLKAKVYVERIETGSVEGTFYNDGQFDHNDFSAADTYVGEWNEETEDYDLYSIQKGTMTVTLDKNKNIIAVASFICENAVQYDLTFKVPLVREHFPYDTEYGELDHTFAANAEVLVRDFIDGYGMIQLIIADSEYAFDAYFNADVMDPQIAVPTGVYPINASFDSGTVLACKGILPDGPAQSYVCGLTEDGYLDENNLWCLVDGTVTVENVDGKLKVEVDGINSYDLPVKVHYLGTVSTSVEDVEVPEVGATKLLKQGQLLIIRNGETYNAMGAIVK